MTKLAKKQILVVDDEPSIAYMVKLALETSNYSVTTASNGQDAILLCRKEKPDLMILDVMMPGMTGYEVCAKLKESRSTAHIPVIMLTAKSQVNDIVTGINSGADDYMVKPFDPAELIVRVEMVLRRVERERQANPLTGLPGNNMIDNEIAKRIGERKKFAVCYLDLDNFKAYNDKYGYSRGNQAIMLLAEISGDVLDNDVTPGESFLGHIGGDDFIIVIDPERVKFVCEAIISRFDHDIANLYTEDDRQRGTIIAKDRRGIETTFPLMTLSIAVVTNRERSLESTLQVADIASEIKKHVKTFSGSNYLLDRRSDLD